MAWVPNEPKIPSSQSFANLRYAHFFAHNRNDDRKNDFGLNPKEVEEQEVESIDLYG